MEQLSAEFRAINPGGTLPVLETDDGTCLVESLAICKYLEACFPDPPLFGTTPLGRGAGADVVEHRRE